MAPRLPHLRRDLYPVFGVDQSEERPAVAAEARGIFQILKAAFKDFGDDECAVRAAALSYYTIFALPPLLILLLLVAGLVWDPQDVQQALEGQFSSMMGESGAKQIHTIIAQADKPGTGGLVATLMSVAGLVFGATGAFMQLQGALNRAWEVKPDPEQGGIMRFITKRALSLGMVLGIGFLLAVSLALTAALSAIGDSVGGGASGPLMFVLNFAVSLVVLALLFASIFKVLPDAEVAWRDVWIGGAVTAVLFTAGKFGIGFYLGRSSPGDAFGAAGALAVVLVWVYYAGMIMLFGAEFTQQWAKAHGSGIVPEKGAVRVIEQAKIVRRGEEAPDDERARAATSVAAPAAAPPAAPEGGIGKALLGVPLFLLLFGRKRGRSGPR